MRVTFGVSTFVRWIAEQGDADEITLEIRRRPDHPAAEMLVCRALKRVGDGQRQRTKIIRERMRPLRQEAPIRSQRGRG